MASKSKNIDYSNCCCFTSKKCGPFKRHELVDKMFIVNELGDLDVKNHLVILKVIFFL